MLIELTFRLDNELIPLDYRKTIVSFFKQALTKYNNKLFDLWYTKTVMKPFCFAVFLSNPIFEGETIRLANRTIIVRIKSDVNKEMIEFYNALLKRKKDETIFKLKNNFMYLTKIRTNVIKKCYENEITIKFDSPLVIKLHDKKTNKDEHLTPNDKNFDIELKNNLKTALERLGYNVSLDGFNLVPLDIKTTVIKIYNGSVAASLGTFKLKGSSELINILNKIGLGSMRSSGFGYFRILEGKE